MIRFAGDDDLAAEIAELFTAAQWLGSGRWNADAMRLRLVELASAEPPSPVLRRLVRPAIVIQPRGRARARGIVLTTPPAPLRVKCEWCRRSFLRPERGRPKRFCRPACGSRASLDALKRAAAASPLRSERSIAITRTLAEAHR